MTRNGGALLREWRSKQQPKCTQHELGRRLRISQGAVSHLEDGASPGLALALRIQALTGIDPRSWPVRRRKAA